MRRTMPLLLMLGGCGFYGEDDPPRPPPWPGEDLPACATTRDAYLVDVLALPATATEARALGQDVDGTPADGTDGVDNMVGSLIQTLQTSLNLDVQAETDAALAADALPIVIQIDTCAEPAYTLVELHRGLSVDRTATPPRVEVADATTLAAVGQQPDPLHAVRGETTFPVLGLFRPEDALWLRAWNLIVDLDEKTPDRIAGRLAMGIDQPSFFENGTLVMTAYLNERIAGQPGCPLACEDDTLDFLVDFFDTDRDGVFEIEELAEDELIRDLTAADLDLLLDGTYWPAQDGENDTISLGLGFEASVVQATAR